MSPREARVVVFEDDPDWRRSIIETLEEAGHHVVATASTLSDALRVIAELSRLRAEVVTIDANLSPYDGDGKDGEIILREIDSKHPEIITIGMSTNIVPGAKKNVGKPRLDSLGDAVNNA